MGLVLTLREGEDFYLGERRIQLERIIDDWCGVLFDPETGERFEIHEDRSTEIAKDVMVCTGVPPGSLNISIEAPRDISVLRGSLKMRGR